MSKTNVDDKIMIKIQKKEKYRNERNFT